MKNGLKVNQFKTHMNQEGGGERVMRAITKTFKSKIYTYNKGIKGDDIEEIGKEMEKILTMIRAVKV